VIFKSSLPAENNCGTRLQPGITMKMRAKTTGCRRCYAFNCIFSAKSFPPGIKKAGTDRVLFRLNHDNQPDDDWHRRGDKGVEGCAQPL
jgi:hypothetical protein